MIKDISPEINPLEGFGKLTFGKSIKEVVKILGDPGNIEEVCEDEFLNTTICSYEDLGLTIFFEGLEDPILSIIEVSLKEATLFGKQIFNMKEKEISTLMRSNGFHEEEREKEEWGEERMSFNDALIDFYFEEDQLYLVNWGVMIDDKGQIQKIKNFINN